MNQWDLTLDSVSTHYSSVSGRYQSLFIACELLSKIRQKEEAARLGVCELISHV